MNKLILFFAFLVLLPQAVSASHSWGNYHWARTANPFTLKVGDNLTSNWDPYLVETRNDWSASTVLDLAIVSGGGGRNCRPTAGRIEVCNRKYGNNGWLGLAQIWISGNHITQGLAKMNDTYFNSTSYNTPAWRRLVMCQEVAHGFGLDHQDEAFNNANLGSCMDYTADPDGPPSNEHPNAHDFEQLLSIYSHLDSTTTLNATLQSHAPFDASDNPSQWGRLVKDNGNVGLYVKELASGQKLFTHVFWAHE